MVYFSTDYPLMNYYCFRFHRCCIKMNLSFLDDRALENEVHSDVALKAVTELVVMLMTDAEVVIDFVETFGDEDFAAVPILWVVLVGV